MELIVNEVMGIKEFADHTRAFVMRGQVDQMEGAYYGDEFPCCIGARLAAFLTDSPNPMWYEGVEAAAQQLGCTPKQVEALFTQAGAGSSPFGANEWPNSRETVWNNLMKIETLPEDDGRYN